MLKRVSIQNKTNVVKAARKKAQTYIKKNSSEEQLIS